MGPNGQLGATFPFAVAQYTLFLDFIAGNSNVLQKFPGIQMTWQ